MSDKQCTRQKPRTQAAVRNIGARLQTREAYRAILRLIHSDSLEVGDLLPKQSDLLTRLGMCQGTVSAAMRWLVADGIVERRKCTGTTVRSLRPANPGRLIWSVGIAMPDVYETPFFPTLTHFLHKHLALSGCANRVYIVGPNAVPADEVDVRRAADFTGLEEDLEAGLLDAIITPTRLATSEVPVCAAAGPEWAELGVIIDHAAMIRAACELLLKRGCSRLGLLVYEIANSSHHASCDVFSSVLKAGGLDVHPQDLIYTRPGLASGREVADQLLSRSADERPDGLVILDDVAAQGFSVRVREVNHYAPQLAVQTNRQAPLAFPLPAYHFEVDVEELARRAVEKTVQRLLKPDSYDGVEIVMPELNTAIPFQ
jgi:DNA-binding LacI/PurR family transcriptional regulator